MIFDKLKLAAVCGFFCSTADCTGIADRAAIGRDAPTGDADEINWPNFLARHDLVWTRLPTHWKDGSFDGNGMMGTVIYQDGNSIRWEISRADVEVATLLDIPVGEPMADVRRVLVAPDGTVIYLAEVNYRGDFIHLDMDLKP